MGQKQPEPSALWESLEKTIKDQRVDVSSGEFSAGVSYSVGDRVSELFLNGMIPLVLLQIVLLSFGGSSHSVVTWSGVLLSPVLALVLRPLCTDHLGLNLPRFLAVGSSLVILLPLTQFLPELTWRNYDTELWLRDRWDTMFAESVQKHLESYFQGAHPLSFSLALLGLALICHYWSHRCPWIDHRSHRSWERVPGLALWLVPIVLLLWLYRPDAAQQAWSLEMEPKYRSLFLSQLPDDGGERVWRELSGRLEELPEELQDQQVQTLREIEVEARELLEHEAPQSRRELSAAQSVFSALARLESQNESALLESPFEVDLALLSPLFHGFRWSAELSSDSEHWLQSKGRTVEDLEEAQDLVRQVLSTLPTSSEELDLEVYDGVYGGGLPQLLPLFHGVTPNGTELGVSARVARRKPLELGPWSLGVSPLNLLLKEQRRTYLGAWLEARKHFDKGMTEQLRDEWKLKGAWKPEQGAQAYFDSRFASDTHDRVRVRLESVEIYLRVRLHQLEHGTLPALSSLAAGWGYEGKRLVNSELSESWRLP